MRRDLIIPSATEQSVMTTPEKFLAKHKDSIVACLACFDRVIFKGYLPFGDDRHLNSFVDWHLKIPRKNFIPMVQTLSQQNSSSMLGRRPKPRGQSTAISRGR